MKRAEALVPLLAERALDAELRRRLPDETIDDVRSAGLFPMVVPTSMGGHGLGVSSLAQSTRVMAHADPAAAWTILFLVMHNWMVAKLPPDARDELFSVDKPWVLVPAPLAPAGTLTATEGGFVVNGRWEWATGVHHAEYVLVHARHEAPAQGTGFAIVPIGDVEIEDVWHTAGMRATGSDAVRLRQVFVPARRVVSGYELLYGGDAIPGDGMSRLPVPPVLALTAAAPALGAAEAATALYRERIAGRVLAYSQGTRAIDQATAHARLGQVSAELAAARALWDGALAELEGCVGMDEVPVARRMAMRLAASTTVRMARRVIAEIADGSGGSVYFEQAPFQRLQRDVEVLKGHVIFDWDRTTELAGRVALGLDLQPSDMV
ncbi:MAG: acyl-CoA dehydrogenase [Desertimonas sp.]